MKRMLILAICLCPALAFAQKTYTNADLVDIEVPGAYTNEDLRRLPPLAVQGRPAAQLPLFEISRGEDGLFQSSFDSLKALRDALEAELDLEMGRIAFSESPSSGDTQSASPRLGYRTKVRRLVQELAKRIALVDLEIDRLLDEARRAGASIDRR